MIIKKWTVLCVIIGLGLLGCQEQPVNEIQKPSERQLDHHPIPEWFEDAKFGIFVHFGVLGHFRYFQQKMGEPPAWISPEVDEVAFAEFTLSDADVAAWSQQFKDWGARYAILTAIQHPGFALWDSEYNDRNIADKTPYGQDLVKAWSESLRDQDIKVGLYFNHEDQGDRRFMEVLEDTTLAAKPDHPYWAEYLALRDNRVRELVSNYGQIDLLWFDADWIVKNGEQLGTPRLVDMIVEKQPNIVFNNRLRSATHGHYGTPEKYIPVTDLPKPFEVCDNLRNSGLWGYTYDDPRALAYKSATEVVYTMVQVLTNGGNYLLNIGPKPDGSIPQRELEIMDTVGTFVNQYAEAIFDSRKGLPKSFFGGGSTWKNGALYLFSDQNGGDLYINGLENKVLTITNLATGDPITYTQFGGRPNHGRPSVIKFPIPENTSGLPVVFKLEVEGEELKLQNK